MELEFKRVAVDEVKADSDKRTIVGYAAAFGNVDSYNDVIERGAFAKTIAENRDRIKTFYNHMYPIGKPEEMREDARGLYTESKVSRTPRGDEVLELIRDGVISEMSIAFETVKSEQDDSTGIRTLTELRLREFGPVDFAANEQATIEAVKSLTQRFNTGAKSGIDPDSLRSLRSQIDSVLSMLEPPKSTPHEPSGVDTRITLAPPEWVGEMAESMKTRQEAYNARD